MKNLIITLFFIVFLISTAFASSINVTHAWSNDSVHVRVAGPDGANDFRFPCSYDGYANTLVPYLGKSNNQEEVAYKLEVEYVHSLEAYISLKKEENSSRGLLYLSVIILCSSALCIVVILSSRKRNAS